ncbi:MAG: cytochrome c3 family protein [Phycisphaeraceae bacterium]|nr:cytochrome c3 family protein [Phycisphaeraceae bacterium]MCB9848642.1 cytochrome c3 family protein [Phycisphaeraceae bacterium]
MKTKQLLLGLAASATLATMASAQIVGSRHDFSSNSWSDGEICKPCHTPHFAMADLPRLWNHELTTATNYILHEGSGTVEDDFDLISRLCLSCHDGTVALDSFGGQTGTEFIPSSANLGVDFTNDHPVGSDALYPPDPQPSWWAGAFNDPSTFPSRVGLEDWVDPNGVTQKVVGCATCHNPHNRDGFDLLNISNNASALCLTCHIK